MQENNVIFDVQPLESGPTETQEEQTVDKKFRVYFMAQIVVYLVLLCKAGYAAYGTCGKEYKDVFKW